MVTKRLLVKQPGAGDRWQALQVFDDTGGGARYEVQDLDTPQAARWQQEGGFEIVPGERFNAELQQASATDRAQRTQQGLANAGWLGDSERGGVTGVTMRPAAGDAFDVETTYQSGATQRAGLDRARASALQGLMGANVLPAAFKGLTMAQKNEATRNVAAFQQGLKKPFQKASPAEMADAAAKVAAFKDSLRPRAMPTDSATATRPAAPLALAGSTGTPRLAEPLARLPAGDVEGTGTRMAEEALPLATPTGDEEYTAAEAEAQRRALVLGLARAAQNFNEGLTGARVDREAFNQMAAYAGDPVRRLLAQRKANEAKRMGDPTSEESKRFQAAVAKALPGVYSPEELSLMTAGDRESVMRAGEMRQKLEQRKADIERAAGQRQEDIGLDQQRLAQQQAFQAGEAAKQRAFQRETQGRENAAALERARVVAQQKGAPGSVPGTVIPGLEIAPGAAPTAQDATKVKAALAAKQRMGRLVDELRNLHAQKGTEFVGASAERMGQLSTAIQLEAKTLAELGALTGPDLDIIQRLTGADPSSLRANLKSLVGVDTTQESLRGIEQWAAGQADATQSTYGYQPAGGAAPAGMSPPTAPARTVVDRIRMPDGKTVTLYSDGTEEVS